MTDELSRGLPATSTASNLPPCLLRSGNWIRRVAGRRDRIVALHRVPALLSIRTRQLRPPSRRRGLCAGCGGSRWPSAKTSSCRND
jgi:hypothetical protein